MTNEEHCGNCATACTSGQECRAGICTNVPTFRVLTLGATSCSVVDHLAQSGDDRGGVAITPTQFFVDGDDAMVRMNASDLTSITSIGAMHDGMLGDIGTEQAYVLLNAAGAEIDETAIFDGATATQLGRLDPATGVLTATRIPLSMSIPLDYDTGIFSGWGAAYLAVPGASNTQWWHIELPSGDVTRLGTTSELDHSFCETWAFWGIGERFGGVRYGTFVSGASASIVRVAIPETGNATAAPTTVATFTDLSDMCSITFSTSRNRWYFHHEYDSQFGGSSSGETAGYCPGTFDRP